MSDLANSYGYTNYIRAASNHNVAVGREDQNGFFNGLISSLHNAPKYFTASAASAGIGFYNTGVAVANLFSSGEDRFKEIDTEKWLMDYDTDLGKYYKDNSTAVDAMGFVIGSIIPGMVGVKALNVSQKAINVARQTGNMGKNMQRATGLMVPRHEQLIKSAAREIAEVNTGFRMLDSGVMKAVGSGFGQNALEAAAFEAFAMGAQFNSNFISEMDAKDLVINAAMGIGLGTAIGGVITGTGTVRRIRDQVRTFDNMGRAGIEQATIARTAATTPSTLATLDFQNRRGIRDYIALAESQAAGDVMLPDGATMSLVQKQLQDAYGTVNSINNSITTNVRKLMGSLGNDPKLVSHYSDVFKALDDETGAATMFGVTSIKRVGDVKQTKTFTPGQQTLDVEGLRGQMTAADTNITWVKTYGDDAGSVLHETPSTAPLADRVALKSGESIAKGINRLVKSFKFSPSKMADVASSKMNLNEAQARYIWADELKLKGDIKVQATDTAMLEAAYRRMESGDVTSVRVTDGRGRELNISGDLDSFASRLMEAKDIQIARMIKNKEHPSLIAAKLNVDEAYVLQYGVKDAQLENYMTRQTTADNLGLSVRELSERPQFMGLEGDRTLRDAVANNQIDVDLQMEQLKKSAQLVLDTASAEAMAPLGQATITNPNGSQQLAAIVNTLPSAADLNKALHTASRYGSGARLFTGANGNYGSLESHVQRIGNIKNEMDIRAAKINAETWKDINAGLRSSPADASELAIVNELFAGTPVRYGISPRTPGDSSAALVMRPIQHIREMAEGLPLSPLGDDVQAVVNVKGTHAARAIEEHIRSNGARVRGKKILREAEGLGLNQMDDIYYPIKPDPRTRPFHAIIVDESSSGVARKTMIHAADSKTLSQMISKVNKEFPNAHVLTKDKSAEYRMALGDYDYHKTLNELDFDSELVSKGINSQLIPETDASLVINKFLGFHDRQARKYNMDIISTKYGQVFDSLEKLGREFEQLSTSRYPDSAIAMALQSKDNPYVEYIKTALNISNMSDYGFLVTANRGIDAAVSKVWNNSVNLFRNMRGVDDATIEAVNANLKNHGFKSIAASAENLLIANHRADSAILSKFVRTTQSILATTFLRWDLLHSINNKIGSTIMMGTELRHIIGNVAKGNDEVVGRLTELSHLTLPGTEGAQILSAGKLMANAFSNQFNPVLRRQAVEEGFVPRNISDAFTGVISDLTLDGTETAIQLNRRMASAVEGAKKLSKGLERATGNSYTEFLNRFMAFDIMRQMTDPLIDAGIISRNEAKSYISTFVNRTQVNLNSAQRPLAFQGPVGMAVGLFQSYQFNLFQQLFRYIGDGNARTVATMAGLQGSFYGLSGLPGFKFLNDSIIGQAAGNHSHADVHTEARGALGKELAELLIYGAPSAALGQALYSRGDLTPQHPTVIPSRIQDLPVVSMYGNMYRNLSAMKDNIANGAGLWNSILTGLEHNSFNRPLSGLAQMFRGATDGTGEVRSYDRSGQFIAANDLWHLSTLFRLAGGKPLDEAVVRDEKWRTTLYQQADSERRKKATVAMRVAMASDNTDYGNALEGAFDIFTNTGGKSKDFNRWALDRYTESNVTEAERLLSNMQSPYAQRMQLMISGSY